MISDVRFSGSTCTSVITYGRKLYCANVGDSRSIIIKAAPNSADGKLVVFHASWLARLTFLTKLTISVVIGCTVRAISRDHKPDDIDEKLHIEAHNGRVDCYKDHMGN